MRKVESIIALLLAAVVFFSMLAIQRQWEVASLKDMASTAEEFILTSAGISGTAPDISGYERVRSYDLGKYRAGFYRATPSPLVFASYRLVIYNRNNKPVFSQQSVEAAKDPWTTLYDFAGRHGLHPPGSRARPVYTRDLAGTGSPEVILGQYSGGDHCCTTAIILELGDNDVRVLGRIGGLDGLPFEGLELRRLDADKAVELVAHRPYQTICGSHLDAADAASIYDYADGAYSDRTPEFAGFMDGLLQQNLARWAKGPSLQLLQTITLDYARLGKRDMGDRFFALNLARFVPDLRKRNVDPNTCMDDMEGLVGRIANPP